MFASGPRSALVGLGVPGGFRASALPNLFMRQWQLRQVVLLLLVTMLAMQGWRYDCSATQRLNININVVILSDSLPVEE